MPSSLSSAWLATAIQNSATTPRMPNTGMMRARERSAESAAILPPSGWSPVMVVSALGDSPPTEPRSGRRRGRPVRNPTSGGSGAVGRADEAGHVGQYGVGVELVEQLVPPPGVGSLDVVGAAQMLDAGPRAVDRDQRVGLAVDPHQGQLAQRRTLRDRVE